MVEKPDLESLRKFTEFDYKNAAGKLKRPVVVIVALIGAFILFAILNPFVIIRAGTRGVVLNWGAVSDDILQEGIHMRVPIMQEIVRLEATVQKETARASASSKDLQIVTANVTVTYTLNPDKVNIIYQSLRMEYPSRVVQPAIEEFVKKATAKFTAEELITKREVVKNELKDSLAESLKKHNILLDDVFITDFNFSAEFNNAIEAKVTAEQEALKAKNILERVKYEAEAKITSAKAEAETIRIQAQALEKLGGKDYVSLKAVEKWDGKLPQQMIPGSAVPFIDLKGR